MRCRRKGAAAPPLRCHPCTAHVCVHPGKGNTRDMHAGRCCRTDAHRCSSRVRQGRGTEQAHAHLLTCDKLVVLAHVLHLLCMSGLLMSLYLFAGAERHVAGMCIHLFRGSGCFDGEAPGGWSSARHMGSQRQLGGCSIFYELLRITFSEDGLIQIAAVLPSSAVARRHATCLLIADLANYAGIDAGGKR